MRFKTVKHNASAWKVIDSQAREYGMPEQAVSMFLSEEIAIGICLLLNEEWQRFVANPS